MEPHCSFEIQEKRLKISYNKFHEPFQNRFSKQAFDLSPFQVEEMADRTVTAADRVCGAGLESAREISLGARCRPVERLSLCQIGSECG